jgi:hypothetical protein
MGRERSLRGAEEADAALERELERLLPALRARAEAPRPGP